MKKESTCFDKTENFDEVFGDGKFTLRNEINVKIVKHLDKKAVCYTIDKTKIDPQEILDRLISRTKFDDNKVSRPVLDELKRYAFYFYMFPDGKCGLWFMFDDNDVNAAYDFELTKKEVSAFLLKTSDVLEHLSDADSGIDVVKEDIPFIISCTNMFFDNHVGRYVAYTFQKGDFEFSSAPDHIKIHEKNGDAIVEFIPTRVNLSDSDADALLTELMRRASAYCERDVLDEVDLDKYDTFGITICLNKLDIAFNIYLYDKENEDARSYLAFILSEERVFFISEIEDVIKGLSEDYEDKKEIVRVFNECNENFLRDRLRDFNNTK